MGETAPARVRVPVLTAAMAAHAGAGVCQHAATMAMCVSMVYAPAMREVAAHVFAVRMARQAQVRQTVAADAGAAVIVGTTDIGGDSDCGDASAGI